MQWSTSANLWIPQDHLQETKSFVYGSSQNHSLIMLIHGILLSSLIPFPYGRIWWKVSALSISMVRRRSPSSPFTIRNKSLPKGSLILLDGSEIPPSIVMDSTKSKSWQKFASTTCSRNTEHTWRTLTFTNLPNYSKKLRRQPYQLSHLSLISLAQKKETPLKLLPSPTENQQQG